MSLSLILSLALLASSILPSVTPLPSSTNRKLHLHSPNPGAPPTAAALVPRTERVLSSNHAVVPPTPAVVPPTPAQKAKVRRGGVSSVVGFIMTAYLGLGLFYLVVLMAFLCLTVTPEEWVTDPPVIVVAADPAGDAPAPDPPLRRRMNLVDCLERDIIKFINCMGRCNCLRRIGQALSHLFWVMKGIGTPFIYTYLILRIMWPSFVYLGIAAPWNDALEDINRAHFEY